MNQKHLLLLLVLISGIVNFAAFPVDKSSKEKIEQIQLDKIEENSQQFFHINTSVSNIDVENSSTPSALDSGKSQLVALILVIFVGVLGIHRFYLGYTGIGIIQLLTCGGCGIWALIDLIMIATGELKPKDGDYTSKL